MSKLSVWDQPDIVSDVIARIEKLKPEIGSIFVLKVPGPLEEGVVGGLEAELKKLEHGGQSMLLILPEGSSLEELSDETLQEMCQKRFGTKPLRMYEVNRADDDS